jgi:hypothetical protein
LRRACALLVALAACRAPPSSGARALVVGNVSAPGVTQGEPVPDETETPRVEIAIAFGRMCTRVEGRVYCIDGPIEGRALASGEPMFGIEDAIDIAIANGFGCIARARGTVSCWGANEMGQLGAGIREEKSDVAVEVAGVTNARRVAVGERHACALLADGGVACWGDNTNGATSGPVAYTEGTRELVSPDIVPRISGLAIAATHRASYAVTTTRELATWGASVDEGRSEAPRTIGGLTAVEDVAASGDVMCAMRLGEVSCLGSSFSLFPGFRGRAERPQTINTHGRARRVRVAERHACALLFDGRVECWGSNAEGALGRRGGSPSETYSPDRVDDLPHALDVFVGASMSCAVTGRHEASCWGSWMADEKAHNAPAPLALRID